MNKKLRHCYAPAKRKVNEMTKKDRKQMKESLVDTITQWGNAQSYAGPWIKGLVPENYEQLMADAALARLNSEGFQP